MFFLFYFTVDNVYISLVEFEQSGSVPADALARPLYPANLREDWDDRCTPASARVLAHPMQSRITTITERYVTVLEKEVRFFIMF